MKGKTSNKLLALLSVVLIIALVAVPVGTVFKAYAAPNNYLPGTSGTASNVSETVIKKTIQIEKSCNIPGASFDFTIEAGSHVAGSGSTIEVLAGIDPGNVEFKLDNGTSKNGGVTLPFKAQPKSSAATDYVTIVDKSATDGYYLATKDITLNFNNVLFTEPGVYRYIITEALTPSVSGNAGVGMDAEKTRTLDVYVVDATTKNASGTDNKQLRIDKYILYVGTVTAAPSATASASGTTSGTAYTGEDGSSAISENGAEVTGSKKSVGFLNYYPTAGITFGKEVTGNQGSKDKYFKYTLQLNNVNAGDSFEVILAKADSFIKENVNTATTCIPAGGVTQPNIITVSSGTTSISQDFYLQDGQYITVNGIYNGITYTLTENAEEYTSTAGITAAESTFDKDNDDIYDELSNATSGTIAQNGSGTVVPIYTGFTNDKTGAIPTGVILSVAPWIIAGLVIVAGVVFFAVRSKKKYEEQ